ncbi:MAG: precorrin-2 C(20)-methyltransferase [Oscillospiraceae bacterium]
MTKGTLFGVSVGPGDPELMTLKAVRALEKCEVIAAPETKGEKTLALDIVRGEVQLDGKDIFYVSFPMTRDAKQLQENYSAAADRIIGRLDANQNVAMINLGDVSIYSTFSYIADIVAERGYQVEIIAGVPSFCAVAARLKTSLTQRDDILHVVPASAENIDEILALKGTKVIMKTGKSLSKTLDAIEKAGAIERTSMVQNCGLATERVCKSVSAEDASADYFTTIIVKE